ncbi:hypothetical protein A0J57_18895 [Sphingobium sp. 22B]|uniref:alpha/beta hydrolase n=1 Tax=unclassified Sphingobium TaxID=2611147 RepID=UPI0007822391|nr:MULTISPECIES: alpha/beta hydrolase [unclassified Sphingobium]KXU30507.1 hypothetical protein AXW74_17500 [Sphingobium sp. AM]KYC30766.1 hypothetical protein A0J57_18895 [Sphingobium sp. 22B]OAP30063.1 hypothetical protein A8O16_20480 [Sphingobium sp. 20006FA]
MNPPFPLVTPLEPGADKLVQAFLESGRQPYERLAVSEARAAFRESSARFAFPAEPGIGSRDDHIDLPGRSIPVRIYRPDDVGEAAPLTVFFHGGGWVVGDLDTHDSACRLLSALSRSIVIAVDYRLGPENPFPAAAEDAIGCARWIARHAADFGGDPAHLSLFGDSGGGTLALVAALALRGEAPLTALVLFYPVGDLGEVAASMEEFRAGYPLTASSMRWFRDLYLGDVAQAVDARASPIRTPDLGGLPPTLILSTGHDPLRDDTIRLAAALEAGGTPTTHRHLPGMLHGFITLGGAIPSARDEVAHAALFLRSSAAPAKAQA